MSRLPLSVQEARHLFHNLQQDLRQVCIDEIRGDATRGDATQADADAGVGGAAGEVTGGEGEEFEAIWSFVERELRGVYEMSRFALDVKELGPDAHDIDVFRGNCEDYAGIEPRDQTYIQKISANTQTIQDYVEQNAVYRVSVPAKIEQHFLESVRHKRELFNRLESPSAALELPTDLDMLPASVLEECMGELAGRLTRSVELVAAVLEPAKADRSDD